LANIAEAVTEPMLVVYGDSLVRFDLDALMRAHRSSGAEATIALFDRDRHPHTGIAGGRVRIDAKGRITAFVEGADAESGLVNAGVYAVEPSLLGLIPPDQLVDFGRDVFPAMLGQGRALQGWIMEDDGYCLGLDTPESHAEGVRLLETGLVTP